MSLLSSRFWKIRATEIGSEFKEWVDIDFDGTVHKTIHKEPNKTEITIFNLKESSRAFLAQNGVSLEVTAGYASNDLHGRLFKSQIDIITNVREGVEWKTKLVCRDGAKTTRNAKIEKTFAAGTSNKAIINELIKILTSPPKVKVSKAKRKKPPKKSNVVPLKKGNIDLSKVINKISKARTLKGLAIDYLGEFTRAFNLRMQINDGSLHIVGSNVSILDQIIILDPDSGLIGVPEQTEIGWKFKSLLRFDLEPGQEVRVKSNALDSKILITEITHKVATQGEWTTLIEGVI